MIVAFVYTVMQKDPDQRLQNFISITTIFITYLLLSLIELVAFDFCEQELREMRERSTEVDAAPRRLPSSKHVYVVREQRL